MAEQIRAGRLKHLDLVATLDDPTVFDGLPVLWITNQAGKRFFALTQSYADVHRGAGKSGETWRLWINRFGEIFLIEKSLPCILQEIETPQGYQCSGVSFQDGKHCVHWTPIERIILES